MNPTWRRCVKNRKSRREESGSRWYNGATRLSGNSRSPGKTPPTLWARLHDQRQTTVIGGILVATILRPAVRPRKRQTAAKVPHNRVDLNFTHRIVDFYYPSGNLLINNDKRGAADWGLRHSCMPQWCCGSSPLSAS